MPRLAKRQRKARVHQIAWEDFHLRKVHLDSRQPQLPCFWNPRPQVRERVGVAIFDHPENPRHPTRWHVRGYGLFSANPFGLAAFTGNKSQSGDLTLEPGQSLRFRYRVVIHAGNAQSAGIAKLYDVYIQETKH